jgi:hypothetical protein
VIAGSSLAALDTSVRTWFVALSRSGMGVAAVEDLSTGLASCLARDVDLLERFMTNPAFLKGCCEASSRRLRQRAPRICSSAPVRTWLAS